MILGTIGKEKTLQKEQLSDDKSSPILDPCKEEIIDEKNIIRIKDNNGNNDARKRNAKSITPINLSLVTQGLHSDSGNPKMDNGVARSRR